MAPPSFIPGYKNMITETLYQTENNNIIINNDNSNIFTKDIPTYVNQSASPFIPAYFSYQYQSDTPYKNAIFTPTIILTNPSEKKCNPLVAYPYGVPQKVNYEKCDKCKGDKKCNKMRRQRKHKNVDMEIEKEKDIDVISNLDGNSNENNKETANDLDNKINTDNYSNCTEENIKKNENIITKEGNNSIKILNILQECMDCKNSDIHSNISPRSNNIDEICNDNVSSCQKQDAVINTNDIDRFIHLCPNGGLNKDNSLFMNTLSSVNFNQKIENEQQFHETQNVYTNLQNMEISENIHFNHNSPNNNDGFFLNILNENIDAKNIYTSIERIVDDRYELGFNPFADMINPEDRNLNKTESYTALQTQNNKKEVEFYSQAQEEEEEEEDEEEEEEEEIEINSDEEEENNDDEDEDENENENEDELEDENTPYEEAINNILKMNSESKNIKTQSSEQKNIIKLDLENGMTNLENQPKKIIKKKKNMTNNNADNKNNNINKNKKNDQNPSKLIKVSYARFDLPDKLSNKRVCRIEGMMEEAIKNELELKAKQGLKQYLRISMTNADELFSPKSARKILSDRKKTTNKNTPNKETKTESVSNVNTISASPKNMSTKKYGIVNSSNKNMITSSKNVNTSSTIKKGSIRDKATTGSVNKKLNTVSVYNKKKNKTNETLKKSVSKTQTAMAIDNISERSENKKIEKEEEQEKVEKEKEKEGEQDKEEQEEDTEEQEEDKENENINRKMLLSRSTTKFYGEKKTVPFKNVQVKKYTNNAGTLKSKDTVKFKKTETVDKKKKLEAPKSKKNLNIIADTEAKAYRKATIAGKLKSKKKELYANILSLTKNITSKDHTEEIKKKKDSKEKLQIISKNKEESTKGSNVDNVVVTGKPKIRKSKFTKDKLTR